MANYDLPNLEVMSGEPSHVVSTFLPLVRQHAFEARLYRTLKSLDAGGLLDPRTGLLTLDAFHRELTRRSIRPDPAGQTSLLPGFRLVRSMNAHYSMQLVF